MFAGSLASAGALALISTAVPTSVRRWCLAVTAAISLLVLCQSLRATNPRRTFGPSYQVPASWDSVEGSPVGPFVWGVVLGAGYFTKWQSITVLVVWLGSLWLGPIACLTLVPIYGGVRAWHNVRTLNLRDDGRARNGVHLLVLDSWIVTMTLIIAVSGM